MPVSQALARGVAEQLFSLERSLDQALTEAVKLQGQLVAARQEGNLSAGILQPTMEKVTAAIGAITEARGGACDAHARLAVVQRKLGLGAVAFGPFEDKPATPAALQVVESAA